MAGPAEPAQQTVTPAQARRGLRARAADRLQDVTDRLRGTPARRRQPEMGPASAGALIRDSARAADVFLRGLEADLRTLLRRENLVERLSPELAQRVNSGRALTLEETQLALRTLRENESVQRFLVERLGRLSGETFASTTVGLSLRREIVNLDILDAAFVRQTRTGFIDDLVALAGPQNGPRLRAELEAALRTAGAEGRVDIRRIIFGASAEGGAAAAPAIVRGTLPELERELESIRRAFRTAGTDITAHVDAIDRILSGYESTLGPERAALLDRAQIIGNLRRDLEELARVRGTLSQADMAGFISNDLNPVLQRLRNPQAMAIEAYLERSAANAALLETAPALLRPATTAEEALRAVRNTARWRGIVGRAAGAAGRGIAGGWRYLFGTQVRAGQLEAALARGEEIEVGVARRRPVVTVVTLALLAGLGYYTYNKYHVVPQRVAREEAARVHVDVRGSDVYAALSQMGAGNAAASAEMAFLLDPANRFVALYIVNDDIFRNLAANDTAGLLAEIRGLRGAISANQTLRGMIERQGRQLDAARQALPPNAIVDYRNDMVLRIARQGAAASPILQTGALPPAAQAHIRNYPDIWVWYNLRATSALERNAALRPQFTAEAVGRGILALGSHLDNLAPSARREALALIRRNIIELASPRRGAAGGEGISRLSGLLGIEALRVPPPPVQQGSVQMAIQQGQEADAFFSTPNGREIADRIQGWLTVIYHQNPDALTGAYPATTADTDGNPVLADEALREVRNEVYRFLTLSRNSRGVDISSSMEVNGIRVRRSGAGLTITFPTEGVVGMNANNFMLREIMGFLRTRPAGGTQQ